MTLDPRSSAGRHRARDWLEYDPRQVLTSFDREPFLIRHHLCDHALLQMPSIVSLARRLPERQQEFNSGKIPIGQDYLRTPRTGLSAEETLRQIESCQSWMVLKNVETDPEYGRLLGECLDQLAQQTERVVPGMCYGESFIFVSSPEAVTPYHMDPEHNLLLQIRGSKQMTIFNGRDSALLSDVQLENFHTGAHRNLEYKQEYAAKGVPFQLEPGNGVHVPVTSPHWVKNGPDVSISFSITFRSRASIDRAAIYRMNSMLRARGIRPSPPGRSRAKDSLKLYASRIMELSRSRS